MATKTKKVFIVDDDGTQRQMLKDHLGDRLNVDLLTFSNGEDCLSNLDQQPDIIVLDFHLNSEKPEAMNGLEILKQIKERDPKIEVIMLSSQDKIQVAVETMKNGAYDYVVKGESAFLKAENVISNIFKNFKLQENLKAYKFSTFFLAGIILLVIITAIVLEITGIATAQGWW